MITRDTTTGSVVGLPVKYTFFYFVIIWEPLATDVELVTITRTHFSRSLPLSFHVPQTEQLRTINKPAKH